MDNNKFEPQNIGAGLLDPELIAILGKKTWHQKTIFVSVMGLYYALYLPAIIEAQITYDEGTRFYVSRSVKLLFYGNSICNPIVYVWQNQHFREAFMTILKIPTKREMMSLHQEPTVSLKFHREN